MLKEMEQTVIMKFVRMSLPHLMNTVLNQFKTLLKEEITYYESSRSN